MILAFFCLSGLDWNKKARSARDKITDAKNLFDSTGLEPNNNKEVSGTNRGAIEILFVNP